FQSGRPVSLCHLQCIMGVEGHCCALVCISRFHGNSCFSDGGFVFTIEGCLDVFMVGVSRVGPFHAGQRQTYSGVFSPPTDGFSGVLDLDGSDRCCALLGLSGSFLCFNAVNSLSNVHKLALTVSVFQMTCLNVMTLSITVLRRLKDLDLLTDAS
ncbi:hypothetical protein IRJ41_000759, partial [Triplophysa rosa]